MALFTDKIPTFVIPLYFSIIEVDQPKVCSKILSLSKVIEENLWGSSLPPPPPRSERVNMELSDIIFHSEMNGACQNIPNVEAILTNWSVQK